MTASGGALPVLMALRVKGRATPAAVAAAAGVSEDQARAAIDVACQRGAAVSARVPGATGPESYRLTDSGRDELAALLSAESVDRVALAALYERFLAADTRLKARVSAWQLHAAERCAAGATAEVQQAGAEARALAEQLAEVGPRFAPYAWRLGVALEAVAGGDDRFVASPQLSSLHQVWFELHEDLLLTLGRTRTA